MWVQQPGVVALGGSRATVLVLIGAEPHADWLPARIEHDQWGFIVTGQDTIRVGSPRAGGLLTVSA